MQIQLLGQGFESTSEFSVGNQLIKFFADEEYHTFTGISAFASQAGVIGLGNYIIEAKKHLKIITIVTGVDQKGTSKEALEALLDLKIHTYIFFAPSPFPIFHPKIYLFEGNDKSELIIGSSNLTKPGLFSNVETSLLVRIDNSVEDDKKIVEQLKMYYSGIFDQSDPNLKKITKKLIADLVRAKVVPTEAERRAQQEKEEKSDRSATNSIISKIFPKRAIAKIPFEFRGKGRKKKVVKTTLSSPKAGASLHGKIVWVRKKLPSSSVQRSGIGTNPTGGLRLVQDDYQVNGQKIQHTSYFRNNLFGNYNWQPVKNTPFVEAVLIPFEVTIFSDYKGKFDLEVRHKPSGEAGQGNYTTSISWGEISETIREANLTGSRLELYAPKKKGMPFHIVIN
ncbi:MAG: phospholipase D family protein [Bacteroidales bacterium]|nr:phospholipase D family protein [Bacteroidales bacterium]